MGEFLMKKGILFPIVFSLFVLFLSACGSTQESKVKNTSTSTANKVESIFYDALSSKEKKNVKFKFSHEQDETQDNRADGVFVVSMKIKNQTNKIVKFDKSKFLIFVTEEVKTKSSKSGILKIKPGQTMSLHQIFENVPEQSLVGGGSKFLYLNKNNKLGDADFTIGGNSTSEENTNEESNSTDQNVSAQNSNSNIDDTNNNTNATQDSNGNHVATGSDYDDDNPTAGWDESNLDPSHDGRRWDRILAWTEHYTQVGLDQGMSEDDARNYANDIAWQKEAEYEKNHQ